MNTPGGPPCSCRRPPLTILLLVCLAALVIPQVCWTPEWPAGPVELEGEVCVWPSQTYFFVKGPWGKAAATIPPGVEIKAGQKVKIWGRWSTPEGTFAHWLRGSGALGWIYSNSVIVTDDSQPLLVRPFEWLRLAVKGRLGHPIPQAMLLGDRNVVPKDMIELFDRTGTSHLLAASGLHLSIVVSLLAVVTSKKWPILLVALLYVVLTGGKVGMVRSAIMLTLSFAKLPLSKWQRLLIALIAILIIWPYSVWSVSLWLSFVSTAAVLLVSPLLRRIRGWYSYPVRIAITSTGCQIAALPIVFYTFGRVAFPVCIPANIWAIPVGTVVLSTAFLSFLPLVGPVVGKLSVLAAQLLVWGLNLL